MTLFIFLQMHHVLTINKYKPINHLLHSFFSCLNNNINQMYSINNSITSLLSHSLYWNVYFYFFLKLFQQQYLQYKGGKERTLLDPLYV